VLLGALETSALAPQRPVPFYVSWQMDVFVVSSLALFAFVGLIRACSSFLLMLCARRNRRKLACRRAVALALGAVPTCLQDIMPSPTNTNCRAAGKAAADIPFMAEEHHRTGNGKAAAECPKDVN
jgi:hypothetical protein